MRESLKEQLKAKMIQEIGQRSEGNSWLNLGLGALSYAIAGPMIDAAVDVYVSPAGMKALLAGTEPAMPDGNQSDAFLPSDKTNHPGVTTDVQLSYKTPNLFVISAKDSTPQHPTIKFNFERANLIDWKLTSISLP